MPDINAPSPFEQRWGDPVELLQLARELKEDVNQEELASLVEAALKQGLGPHANPDDIRYVMDTVRLTLERYNQRRVRRFALALRHLQGAALRIQRRSMAEAKASERLDETLAGMQSVALTDMLTGKGLQIDGYYVYCLWGDDESLPLYVGLSTNVLSRLGTHVSDPGKRPHIRRITLTRCRDEKQMRETELRLIRRYRPAWNVVGIPA